MIKQYQLLILSFLLMLSSCDDDNDGGKASPNEDVSNFTLLDEVELEGGETAAEISAYDPATKKLFVVNAVKSAIDVLSMSDPANLTFDREINISMYGGGVNSVALKKGLLAAAVEAETKTDAGKIVVWNTNDLSEAAVITAGSLPDMVTFSPNGKFIVSANEGEPNENYTIDPKGSVSIIDINNNYSVTTLDFTSFNNSAASLIENGYRVFGQDADLAEDTEPEYVTISEDSKFAWVSLQENNAIAKIDLDSKTITDIFPLGSSSFNSAQTAIDPSDKDNAVNFKEVLVSGLFLPDALATFSKGGTNYIITANEGDSRIRPTDDDVLAPLEEGDLFNEEARIKNVDLDPTVFPNAQQLQADEELGRLKITNTLGDTDGDGDYDALFAFGTRSISIWDGNSGALLFDSGNELTKFLTQSIPSAYDDGRSDDKGVEPEGVAIGYINGKTIAFIGLERADAVIIADVTNPTSPVLLQVLATGDAPEGILFIPAGESPNGRSLLVVSSEGDGKVTVFQPNLL